MTILETIFMAVVASGAAGGGGFYLVHVTLPRSFSVGQLRRSFQNNNTNLFRLRPSVRPLFFLPLVPHPRRSERGAL